MSGYQPRIAPVINREESKMRDGFLATAEYFASSTYTGEPLTLAQWRGIKRFTKATKRWVFCDCLEFRQRFHNEVVEYLDAGHSRTEMGRDFWFARNSRRRGFIERGKREPYLTLQAGSRMWLPCECIPSILRSCLRIIVRDEVV